MAVYNIEVYMPATVCSITDESKLSNVYLYFYEDNSFVFQYVSVLIKFFFRVVFSLCFGSCVVCAVASILCLLNITK